MTSPPEDPPLAARRRRNTGAVTIRDVARLAGVAPITVSRGIRSPQSVSPAVMARITQAIQDTGYIPNAVAGALSSGDSRLVAAIVPTISTLTLHPMLEALTNTLCDAGYQVMLGQEGYRREKEDVLLQAILSRKPTGIVLTGMRTAPQWRTHLRGSGIPVVEVWEVAEDPIDMSVGFSHAAMARAAVDFFHARGRRRLALFTGDDAHSTVRTAAAKARAHELGLPAPMVLEFPAPSTLGNGRQGLASLLAQQADIDAIFCASDLLAQGVLIEARMRQLDVPGQLAVMGCGDAAFARDLEPALTTIRIEGALIGREAARFILARTQGRAVPDTRIDVGFQIIARASA
jgi:LacI family gluconate utilization system Gnt-I transcriptional repressor